ncbi:LysR family transcriptional regulator [Kibdelosporangium phytohabitans]|uniref:LysR family transcriptional regulator n=1 Tax=Kibdelosporangium phytohabitans TaxID=860235 RepID=A0A0N9HWB8_9PSEU|nr:LysR substrate-binding domain-containing protein [Kibdelosporangium phytohabitans]ALG09612.1 LysR family transcriptional regulator [Kibdelosporangium phytohabitans]MBE1469049.1 DNA-binding transcriptional LysR family regulator [Kibdelosporangium phytohabitans]
MELRQLEHFLAVAGEGSFTVAAQRTHIVQSALSSSIRKLENELGAQLFERTTRRVILTEAGRALLPIAHRLVADIDVARGAVSEVAGLTRGAVSVGTIQTLTVVDLPRELGVFRSRYPGIRIHVRDGRVADLTAAVTGGELDLAYLAADGPLPGDLACFAQWSQLLVLVTYPGHRLANRRRVPFAQIDDEPFVDYTGSVMQEMVRRRFAAAGLRHNPVCAATHVPLLVDLVAAGLGVTIVPQSVAQRAGLPFAEIDDADFERVIYLAGRQPEPVNPAARALLEHLTGRGLHGPPPAQ